MNQLMKKSATFWRLVFYSNTRNIRHIKNYEIDFAVFNHVDLMQGKYFEGNLPESLRLFVHEGDGPLADQLANPLGLTVMSDRLVKFLYPMITDSVQLLSAPLYERSGIAISGYQILNVIQVIDCVDLGKSPKERDRYGGFIMPTEACIDPNRTGRACMFKFLEPSGRPDFGVTCSYNLLQSLEGQGFTGLAFIPYGASE